MEKLPMCRICLVENVRMYIVIDKDLHELYETLTDIPFVTGDRRPALACFFCFAKLKQCCQLQRQCLEAEELFAQMMNEPSISVNRGQLKYSSGLTVTPVENISIFDVSHIESIAVKEELPADCERQDDVIEPEEEHQSNVKLENVYIGYSNVEDTPIHHCSDTEDDVSLMEFKMEVEEEQEVLRKKRRASDTTRAAVGKREKLRIQGNKQEDVITETQKKNEDADTNVTQNTINFTPKLIPKFEEPSISKKPCVNISIIDTILDTNCRNNVKKLNLQKHPCISRGGAPYKCDICEYSFKNKGNLIKHIRVHTGEKPYKCEECHVCFSQKSHLTRHNRAHSGEKPYKCEDCRLCFSEKSVLTRHIRTHTGEKPYKCKECLLCFSHENTLAKHIRTHTGEKPFKCDVCQSCFSVKGNLTNHIRTHTGEKPYKCEKCQLCFSRKITLTRHMRLHTGEKPYKCDECRRCFSRKFTLIMHIRTHTGKKSFQM